MTYFISGHRDITPEELEKFYVPAIVDVIDTCNDNYDDCEFVVGDCRGCVDMVDELNADLCEDDDPYTIDDCPIVHYVGGFETDRDRDSGTAENILRRHTMKYLNPSFYGQQ